MNQFNLVFSSVDIEPGTDLTVNGTGYDYDGHFVLLGTYRHDTGRLLLF